MSRLQEIVWAASRRARQKRGAIFRRRFKLDETTRILDIGSENGENINLVLTGTSVSPENVFIADIQIEALKCGRERFGYQTVLLDESGRLPFTDSEFDVVYCSSVIEHVTVPKNEIWEIINENEFRRAAWANQKKFAGEVRRVGKAFFVQTPNRGFLIESHSWLPLAGFLPRALLLKVLKVSNQFWIKGAPPDFNLLDARQMAELFPEAEIVLEKKFGLVKSIIAIQITR
jgi:SAM-dependent methyltransferase